MNLEFKTKLSSILEAVWTGLEPATPCVTGMYSNQLNYQTKKTNDKPQSAVWTGLEPATPCVTGMYSNQLNYQTKTFKNKIVGGLDGTRTRDPMRDRHVF